MPRAPRRPSQPPQRVAALPAPSALDAHVGFWLRFVSNHVSTRFRARVEAEGVTVSEWVALRALYDAPAVPTSALVVSLGMTKGAVSKVLTKLEQKHLVRRSSDPDDARVQRMALTPRGRALVPVLASLADENDAHFFDTLSPTQRAALVTTLQRVVHAHGLTQVPHRMRGDTMTLIPETIEHIEHLAHAASAGTLGFGDIVAALAADGIESYRVDYRERTTTYFAPSGAFHVIASAHSDAPIGDTFDDEAIVACIRASQRREIVYPTFVEQSRRAGCVGYTVWIAGRHVAYVGRRGEVHVERFPESLVF